MTLTACPRSATDVVEEVVEQAIALERRRAAVTTGPASTDRCVAMPGELLTATHDWSIDRHVWDGKLYWPTQQDLRVLNGTAWETVMSFAHTATAASPSNVGWFFITQDDDVMTRLVWRGTDGTITTVDAPDGFLLTDVVAVADGAYADAGRTLESQGPASRILHFDVNTRRLATVVERERGVIDLRYDDGLLYWIEYPHEGRGQTGSSRIIAHKPGTTSFVTLAENAGGFRTIELQGEWIYWIESLPDFEAGPIMRAPKAGGLATRVHDPAGSTLVITGDTLFARAGDSKVLRIDLSTGASEIFLEGAPLISLPTIGPKEMYWTAAPAGTKHVATTLCVYRTPLPMEPHH